MKAAVSKYLNVINWYLGHWLFDTFHMHLIEWKKKTIPWTIPRGTFLKFENKHFELQTSWEPWETSGHNGLSICSIIVCEYSLPKLIPTDFLLEVHTHTHPVLSSQWDTVWCLCVFKDSAGAWVQLGRCCQVPPARSHDQHAGSRVLSETRLHRQLCQAQHDRHPGAVQPQDSGSLWHIHLQEHLHGGAQVQQEWRPAAGKGQWDQKYRGAPLTDSSLSEATQSWREQVSTKPLFIHCLVPTLPSVFTQWQISGTCSVARGQCWLRMYDRNPWLTSDNEAIVGPV